jgi:hypothetical protein
MFGWSDTTWLVPGATFGWMQDLHRLIDDPSFQDPAGALRIAWDQHLTVRRADDRNPGEWLVLGNFVIKVWGRWSLEYPRESNAGSPSPFQLGLVPEVLLAIRLLWLAALDLAEAFEHVPDYAPGRSNPFGSGSLFGLDPNNLFAALALMARGSDFFLDFRDSGSSGKYRGAHSVRLNLSNLMANDMRARGVDEDLQSADLFDPATELPLVSSLRNADPQFCDSGDHTFGNMRNACRLAGIVVDVFCVEAISAEYVDYFVASGG